MLYGLYESAAGMMVNEYRQGVISNNLANADTAGFKREIATFSERLTASEQGVRSGPTNPLLESLGGGVWLGKTHTDYSEASFKQSDIPSDVALAGPGFLVVRDAGGNELLTRDGRLMMDQHGALRAVVDGAEILGAGGQPIRLNPRGGSITHIDEDGTIFQQNSRKTPVGRLNVTDVADYSRLQKAGASRFRAPDDLERIESFARIQSGSIEESGSEPIRELSQMLESSRAHQFNAKMISLQDESLGRMISVISGR